MKTRTTLEIDAELLRKAVEVSGATTKTEAIEEGLKELVRKHLTERLIGLSGTLESLYDHEEMLALRRRKKDHVDEWERYQSGIVYEQQDRAERRVADGRG